MAKFTRKEIQIANILVNLVHLIPLFDHRRNPTPAFPASIPKKKRSSTHFARINNPSIPKNVASSPSPDSPLVFSPNAENPSKCRNDGIPIDLDKNPDDVEPCIPDRRFKDGIFVYKRRSSDKGVSLDGECCGKRKREESKMTFMNEGKNSEKGVSLDEECCGKRKKEESMIMSNQKKSTRIFMNKNKNSEKGVSLDGECFKKRKSEESMVATSGKKSRRVDTFS